MEKLEDIVRSTFAGWKSWIEGEFDLTKTHFTAISIAAERVTATSGRAAFILDYSDNMPAPGPVVVKIVFRTFATHEEARADQRSAGGSENSAAGAAGEPAGGSSLPLPQTDSVQTTDFNCGPGQNVLAVKVVLHADTQAQAEWHLILSLADAGAASCTLGALATADGAEGMTSSASLLGTCQTIILSCPGLCQLSKRCQTNLPIYSSCYGCYIDCTTC